MSEKREEQARADRNRERSEEAHWQAAEAGAEEEGRPAQPDPGSGEENRAEDSPQE
jgi:hypothetical protein